MSRVSTPRRSAMCSTKVCTSRTDVPMLGAIAALAGRAAVAARIPGEEREVRHRARRRGAPCGRNARDRDGRARSRRAVVLQDGPVAVEQRDAIRRVESGLQTAAHAHLRLVSSRRNAAGRVSDTCALRAPADTRFSTVTAMSPASDRHDREPQGAAMGRPRQSIGRGRRRQRAVTLAHRAVIPALAADHRRERARKLAQGRQQARPAPQTKRRTAKRTQTDSRAPHRIRRQASSLR